MYKINEERVEVIERLYSEKDTEDAALIDRIERVILIDGKEVYRHCADPLLKMPPTPLDEFIRWLYRMPSKKGCDGGEIG